MSSRLTRTTGPFLAEMRDSTLLVTLNRPERLNALTHEMMDGLRELWQEVRRSPEVRCVVLTGAGRGFCSGADTSLLDAELHVETAAQELEFLPGPTVEVPVVVAVNGAAAGGGLNFVADADIVISTPGAKFLDPHVSVGQVSGVLPLLLRQRIAPSVVSRMALMGRHEVLDAEKARDAGLVSEVVEAERLLERALGIAAAIASNSPEAVRLTRRSLRTFERNMVATNLDMAWEFVRRQRHHPDSAEGPRAFAEKREPRWATAEDH